MDVPRETLWETTLQESGKAGWASERAELRNSEPLWKLLILRFYAYTGLVRNVKEGE